MQPLHKKLRSSVGAGGDQPGFEPNMRCLRALVSVPVGNG